MNLRNLRTLSHMALLGSLASLSPVNEQAQAFTLDLIEAGDDPTSELIDALLKPDGGITVTGTPTFVARLRDGSDPNTAQSATYRGLNLIPNNDSLPTITNVDGILLTSGNANLPSINTEFSFTGETGTGGDGDLSAILAAAGAPSTTTRDVNFLEFDFTVAPGNNAVSAQFVFGSDEFPDQPATDIFAFIVDSVNYATFPDGSLVSFVGRENADNFVDNDFGTGNYGIEYDGLSLSLNVVGLLDTNLTTHTIKIAIADTVDDIFDSGVFIGGLMAQNSDGGGIFDDPPSVPEPTATVGLLTFAAFGAGSILKNKYKQK